MDRKLSKDDVRVRRRILHHITRNLHGDQKDTFEKDYKNVVHGAITTVLLSERLAVEALADLIKKNSDVDPFDVSRWEDEGGPSV